jgi:hypothetical protein
VLLYIDKDYANQELKSGLENRQLMDDILVAVIKPMLKVFVFNVGIFQLLIRIGCTALNHTTQKGTYARAAPLYTRFMGKSLPYFRSPAMKSETGQVWLLAYPARRASVFHCCWLKWSTVFQMVCGAQSITVADAGQG